MGNEKEYYVPLTVLESFVWWFLIRNGKERDYEKLVLYSSLESRIKGKILKWKAYHDPLAYKNMTVGEE